MSQDVNYFVLTLPVTFMKYCPKCGVELLVVQNLQAHLDLCLLSSNYDLKTIDNLKKTKLKKCSNCQKQFSNVLSLEKHRYFCDPNSTLAGFNSPREIDEKNVEKPSNNNVSKKKRLKVECPVCHKNFYQAYLPNHMNVHTGDRPFKCKYCEKGFKDYTGLKSHIQSHENIKQYKCDICDDKAFRRMADLKKHKLRHQGLKPHVCSFCAKAFTSIVSLNGHEQRYHTEDSESIIKSDILSCIFSCLTCEKVFKSKSTLRDHEIRNHGRKGEIFKCEFEGCVKDFTNPALLRNHMRTHTDERPFSCLYCNCNFKAKFHMENHSKRHTKTEGQYQCLECAQAYLNPEHLRLHNLNEHSESRKIDGYQCLSCNEKFKDLISLNLHEQHEHFDLLQEIDIGKVEAIENVEEFIKQERDGTTTVTVVLKTDDVFADL